ncbi:MAG: ADP-ribosylation factor-like protein [Promethearchaeota archaeon]
MKISLIGLAGCGKTSIYATTFAMKTPEATKNLSPTIMYEVRRHPYLGLEISIFDFGGQQQYQNAYLEKPEVFKETDVLIPIVDMHDPDKFEEAKDYFIKIIEELKKQAIKPKIYLLFHKFDTTDYPKELIDANYKKAKEMFEEIFNGFEMQSMTTSIYEQEKLNRIFRDILIGGYENLKAHVEKAEEKLKDIDAKIIVSDISGNVIVHNVEGVNSGLQLRSDFRDYIYACNLLRENLFISESASFTGKPEDNNMEIELHIFKYVLAVLIIKSKKISVEHQEKISQLLIDLALFADLVIQSHNQ